MARAGWRGCPDGAGTAVADGVWLAVGVGLTRTSRVAGDALLVPDAGAAALGMGDAVALAEGDTDGLGRADRDADEVADGLALGVSGGAADADGVGVGTADAISLVDSTITAAAMSDTHA